MTQLPITISGNLIADPEFRQFESSGAQLCKMRVATSRRVRTEDKDDSGRTIWNDTDHLYIDVECWGQLAVNATASLRKGFPVIATGYLVTDVWEQVKTEEDGSEKKLTRYSTKLKAGRVAFELSNFQVSSQRTSSNGNTPTGMEPVEVRTATELGASEPRVSAEDSITPPRKPALVGAGVPSTSEGDTPPF
ncbi:Single-stranded DNA-binding protein [Corynebacterium capitovis DSM 44611]|uniref:single-stranded DNA-binding protein n=1 Tax=Corynebacterium capitovis TaxID=131081 RepID=UPI00037870A4|nr:single-stranded DNA-binding protein [Corynebacterium capitovis]WKD57141.1 Single-stranded DNA-binding protein [Corynebacterium capitovis DSM 44611]